MRPQFLLPRKRGGAPDKRSLSGACRRPEAAGCFLMVLPPAPCLQHGLQAARGTQFRGLCGKGRIRVVIPSPADTGWKQAVGPNPVQG